MMDSVTSHRRQRAFTLVELLVVIGIIALLIAILMPSLSKARQSAMTLKCAAQMRNMGQAVNIYSGQYKGKIPRDTFADGYFFANLLSPYLGGVEIPTDRYKDVNFIYDAYKAFKVYQCPTADELYTLTYTVNSVDFERYQRTRVYEATPVTNVVRVPKPAELAYIMGVNIGPPMNPKRYDNWDIWNPVTQATFDASGKPNIAELRMISSRDKRHGGRTNLVFLDGHVETRLIAPKELLMQLFNPFHQ
jgi:prepilin-type processing-associated H-X9-DG protein/prepilin-type N-terminal cleavage/methylation domain-containing protein